MSVIVLGVIAAAVAGLGGVVALARRRRPVVPPRSLEAPRAEPPPVALVAQVGDVLQHGDLTRWPRAGALVHDADELVCALLFSSEDGRDQASVALAPPARHLLWLERRRLDLPPKPPTRIEIDGYLLERRMCFPARLEPVGDDPGLGDQAVFALYEGHVGDAAVVIVGDESRVWYGQRLDEGDFDNLGAVEDEA